MPAKRSPFPSLPSRPILTTTDRDTLLAGLARLGDPDPAARAAAALTVADVAGRARLIWPNVIQPDWRAEVQAMLAAPGIDPVDRDALRTVLRWRAPGMGGRALIRDIRGKLAGRMAA